MEVDNKNRTRLVLGLVEEFNRKCGTHHKPNCLVSGNDYRPVSYPIGAKGPTQPELPLQFLGWIPLLLSTSNSKCCLQGPTSLHAEVHWIGTRAAQSSNWTKMLTVQNPGCIERGPTPPPQPKTKPFTLCCSCTNGPILTADGDLKMPLGQTFSDSKSYHGH